MTQYRVEEPEEALSSLSGKTTGQPRVIASGDHVAEDDLDEAKETAETKAS